MNLKIKSVLLAAAIAFSGCSQMAPEPEEGEMVPMGGVNDGVVVGGVGSDPYGGGVMAPYGQGAVGANGQMMPGAAMGANGQMMPGGVMPNGAMASSDVIAQRYGAAATNPANAALVQSATGPVPPMNRKFNTSGGKFKSLYFGFDQYGINAAMRSVLAHNALVAKGSSAKIKIEGNCDEFGTDAYNYALSLKRAKSVKDALVRAGVSSSRIKLVGLGESAPVCSSATQSCYKRNRRVDLKFVR